MPGKAQPTGAFACKSIKKANVVYTVIRLSKAHRVLSLMRQINNRKFDYDGIEATCVCIARKVKGAKRREAIT